MYSGYFLKRSLSYVLFLLWKWMRAVSFTFLQREGSYSIVSSTLGIYSQDYMVRSTDFLGAIRGVFLWSELLR